MDRAIDAVLIGALDLFVSTQLLAHAEHLDYAAFTPAQQVARNKLRAT